MAAEAQEPAGWTANLDEASREKAAGAIQRTYRGHRTRRQLQGFGLDASTRWYEAVKDAQYQKLTTPAPPEASAETEAEKDDRIRSPTHKQWHRVTQIARRAGADDTSPSFSGESSSDCGDGESPEKREEQRAQRKKATEARRKNAKIMDLQYFLEMVDQKHRYGSNLRKYHAYWQTQDTSQNFFYWLDEGDGRTVDLEERSRARLDREQVRYLSREERMQYLVKVNKEGLLIWAKNGELVWTKDELYKDSVKGIVPTSDPAPPYKYNVPPPGHESESSSSESESESEENAEGDEGERYVSEDFHRAKGPAKLKHVSAAVLFNHMVRTSMKKGHKWIFVADTSFRLYVGYKQSGSFQHSSFLHGSRITSAGLIKIKHGQLRKLSPLSGHYRPPAKNFRDFVHALRDEGVDMSRVSISRSYAVLIGMESYTRTSKKIKNAGESVVRTKDKVLDPEKAKREEEASRDKSKSAEKERQYLERQRQEKQKDEQGRKGQHGIGTKLSKAVSKFSFNKDEDKQVEAKVATGRRVMGTGPEDGVPPPEGTR